MVPTNLAKQNALHFRCVFPVKFSFFPVYFRNKIIRFVTSKIKHRRHATIFSTRTFLISTFYLKIFKFPVFWQNYQIPCVFLVWKHFSPFSLFSLFFLWSGNPDKLTKKDQLLNRQKDQMLQTRK